MTHVISKNELNTILSPLMNEDEIDLVYQSIESKYFWESMAIILRAIRAKDPRISSFIISRDGVEIDVRDKNLIDRLENILKGE